MKNFSSKDFGKVPNQLNVELSDKLIDKNVGDFSIYSVDNDVSLVRNHRVKVVDLPSIAISMTIGELLPNQSTRTHRHNYETVIYVVEGEGKSILEEKEIFWQKGDAIYVPIWAWHSHVNLSPKNRCVYIACENAPMLQNLRVALREEKQSLVSG